MRVPSPSSASRVSSSRREIAAMVGKASPRNPSVAIESRSSAGRSLDVAWRSKASRASAGFMPQPSSITRIRRLPPDSVSMRIERAPASSAFSSSSFTTDAGRSTTSPAAILLATVSGSMRMRLMKCVSRSANQHIPNPETLQWVCQSAVDTTSCVLLCRHPCFRLFNGDSQVVQLIRAHCRRRLGHQILRRRRLREGNHLADGFFAGQQHYHAVESQSDAPVRWRAVSKRIEKKPEPLACLFFAQPQRLEHTRLHILAMNSYAPGTQFDAVEHKVVALRTALPWRGFQLVEIFLDDPGEGGLRAHPPLVALAPFKEREAGNPREFPSGTVNQIELVAQIQAHLARNI